MPALDGTRCLIVDDDPTVCRALSSVVRRDCEPVIAASAAEARFVLDAPGAWRAFFVDVLLPDGSGLDVLAEARRTHPTTPAMILTGVLDPSVVNAAYDMTAACCIKPVTSERILQLLHLRTRSERVVAAWVTQYSLSPAEAEVLLSLALGSSRASIAVARGSSELTVKKQIANALAKMGAASVLSIVQRLLAETTA